MSPWGAQSEACAPSGIRVGTALRAFAHPTGQGAVARPVGGR
jgi:hypothetical protein